MMEVLDVGAGRYPAPGATRAIDKDKSWILATQFSLGEVQRPPSLCEYKEARAERIPYPDGFFGKVISRWALGPRIFSRRAYREIARVLKPGGRVEIKLLWKDRRFKRRIVERLAEVGVPVYVEQRGIFRKPGKHLVEFEICGRKDGD